MDKITRDTRGFKWVETRTDRRTFPVNIVRSLTHLTATLVGTRVIVVGKVSRSMDYWGNNCCSFDVVTSKWSWTSVLGPRFEGHDARLVDDYILVYGETQRSARQLWKLDLLSLKWQGLKLKPPRPPSRTHHICEFIEGQRILVGFGGLRYVTSINTLIVINVDTLEWVIPKQTGSPPLARHGHASCSISTREDATIFIYAGRNDEHCFSDLHLLYCRKGSFQWSQPQEINILQPVAFASITYADGRLLVFGGFTVSLADSGQIAVREPDGKWHDLRSSDGEFDLYGSARVNSIHRAVPCYKGILFFGGYNRRFPGFDILSGMA